MNSSKLFEKADNSVRSEMQVFFDKACQGIKDQGKKSYVGGTCKYRYEESPGVVLRCSIGQMLTDDQLQRFCIKEGETPHQDFPDALFEEMFPSCKGNKFFSVRYCRAFLSDMQDAHDGETMGDNFVTKFIDHANKVAVFF